MASSKRLIVDNLMAEIRRMSSEQNIDGSIADELLLDCLNRAQDEASMLLGRHYPAPLITYTTFVTTANECEYDIPEDCLEGRVQKLEYIDGSSGPRDIDRCNYFDNSDLELSSGQTSCPLGWFELGYDRKVRLLPQPQAGLTIRVWYLRELPAMVVSQGKILDVIDATSVELDAIGDAITQSKDEEGSVLSIIDGQTGLLKGVLQVASTPDEVTNIVTFKSSPTITAVDNVTIDSSLTTIGANTGDYVCVGPNSCLCQIRQPFTSYMIQYAFALIQQVNGADVQMAYAALNRLEKFIKTMDKGKAANLRVTQNSHAYHPNASLNWPPRIRNT